MWPFKDLPTIDCGDNFLKYRRPPTCTCVPSHLQTRSCHDYSRLPSLLHGTSLAMNRLIISSLLLTISLASCSVASPVENPPSDLSLQRREIDQNQGANIQITAYASAGCTGTVTFDAEITYTAQNQVQGLFQSISANRALFEGEQLDFSTLPTNMQGSLKRRSPPGMCGLFKSTTTQVGNCLTLQGGKASCLRLWHR